MNNMSRTSLLARINALPYTVIFTLWGSSVFFFAICYTVLSYFPGHGPTGLSDSSLLLRFLNSLYYSIITATNTGYGDIVPLGYSRIFAAAQSISELFLFGVFIAKLVSHRQDTALQEVHKLSFELMFHNIREDFYVARKDFDHITKIAEETREVPESELERLTIAYQHVTSLLQEIPNFYDVTSDLYIIDPRREVLLLEAVQRTTARINHMLETMSNSNIDYRTQEDSLIEMKNMLDELNTLMPLWRKHSHHQNHNAFEKISRSLHALGEAFQKP